jgi:hypothetical protein
MTSSQDGKQPNRQRVVNLAIVGLLGQVGCITLLIILGALFLGLWLDARFGTRPVITIVVLIASIPISLLIMFAVVRMGLARLKPQSDEIKQDHQKE